MDSLSQSLIVKTDTEIKEKTNSNLPDNSGILSDDVAPNSNNLGVAQLAAAIRARRAKLGGASIAPGSLSQVNNRRNFQPLRHKSPNVINVAGGNSNGSQGRRRFNAEELILAYKKGRRDFAYHNIGLLNLKGSDLSLTNFHCAQLTKTNLEGANLENSDFGRASLKEANLKDANLSKAYLSYTDLEKADMRGADLSHAYMSQANLRGANLCGANLTGAKVTDEQLALAKTNWLTIRPNGKREFL